MPNWNKRIRRSCIFALMLVVTLVSPIQAQEDTPHFGSELVLTLQRTVLSPRGNFAASGQEHENEVVISLWDMRLFAAGGTPTRAEATRSISLSHISEPELYSNILLEFSPDERYLAVRKDHDITLLTVPDLAVHEVMSVPAESSIFWDEIAWSPEANLLAVELDTAELLVWDVDNDKKSYYHWLNFHGPIIGTSDGWLLKNYYDYPYEWAFMACERSTESCTGYAWNEIPVSDGEPFQLLFSPIGEQVIAIWFGEEVTTKWVWWRQADGRYQLDAEPFTTLELQSPQVFSPDGQYLITSHTIFETIHKANDNILRRQKFYNIWNTHPLDLIQSIDVGDMICSWAFFPNNSEYFVADCRDDTLLRLYQIGEDEPLDVVDMHAIAALDTDDFFDEYYERRPEEIDISQDGQWVLINYGYGKLLVPVIFPE